MKRHLTLLLIVFHLCTSAQTTFQKTYGGTVNDYGYAVQPTNDGGYIISGLTIGFGAVKPFINLIKTDSFGDTLWTKRFQGNPGYSILQCNDGGYVIAGTIDSIGAGNNDVLLLKTDSLGSTLWVKTYGNVMDEGATCVKQTADNGYIITGTEEQGVGMGLADVYLIKTDLNGNLIWTKTYRGGNQDTGLYTCQTNDGGYVIAGTTQSFYPVGSDIYLIKTDNLGDTLWTKVINGSYLDQAYYIEQTTDGGFIISGQSASFGPYKAILIRTDSAANILWAKTYGNGNNESAKHAQQTFDGGYILAGYGDTGGGNYDIYLTKTDSLGNLEWCRTFGGTNTEIGYAVKQTSDGGFVVIGQTNSFGAGYYDLYLIKTDAYGNTNCNQNIATPIVTTVTYPFAWFSATVLSGSLSSSQLISEGSGLTVSPLCISTDITEPLQTREFQLFPNPFTTSTSLSLNRELKNADLRIYDLLGKEILRKTNIVGQDITIDNENLNVGIYFFSLIEDNQVVATGKLITQ